MDAETIVTTRRGPENENLHVQVQKLLGKGEGPLAGWLENGNSVIFQRPSSSSGPIGINILELGPGQAGGLKGAVIDSDGTVKGDIAADELQRIVEYLGSTEDAQRRTSTDWQELEGPAR